MKSFDPHSHDVGGVGELIIYNSCNLGKVNNAGIIGTFGGMCLERTLNIENCYNAGESNTAIIGKKESGYEDTVTTVNIKNTY